MMKTFFNFAILICLSLLVSCSEEIKFTVDIEKAFCELSARNENLSENNSEVSQKNLPQKSGFVSYFDKNFVLQKINFDSSARNLELQTSKGNISAILIYFETDSMQYQYSGLIYPCITEFSVHSAFCAFIYQKLMNCTFDSSEKTSEFCSYFNWQKFYQSILKFENPFLLNSDLICNDIATSQFSAYSLKLKE